MAMSFRWSGLGGTLSLFRMNEWVHQQIPIGTSLSVSVGPELWVNNNASAAARSIQVYSQYLEQS